MMKSYPVFLIGMERKKAVVVGGGKVAARKVEGLLAAGACVTVISPQAVPEITTLASSGALEWVARAYLTGDLQGSFLVIAATDDLEINQAVSQEASDLGCLINVVDNPPLSSFIVPALVRRGELILAVSTGGASPALARMLRTQLEDLFGPEYAVLIELLEQTRPSFIAQFPDPEARLVAVQNLLTEGLLDVIKRDGREAAMRRINDLLV
jgi:precorrin-2 dehydrogenase / sirohydrochlorin ferrochelatase